MATVANIESDIGPDFSIQDGSLDNLQAKSSSDGPSRGDPSEVSSEGPLESTPVDANNSAQPSESSRGNVPESAYIDPYANVKALRKELRKLRRGREMMAMRVKKSRRELGVMNKKQKEAENIFTDWETAVGIRSKRLGCAAEGLPEIDEWRELSQEHRLRKKEFRKQLVDERTEHEARIAELTAELVTGGRPETEKSKEVEEYKARRWLADERCGQLQVVRDYVKGELDIPVDELAEFLQPSKEMLAHAEAQGHHVELSALPVEAYSGLGEVVLEEMRERHKENLRDLVQLSNAAISRKDSHLKALGYNVLGRGLEDTKLCTPAERNSLRELLGDVESICAWRVSGGLSRGTRSS